MMPSLNHNIFDSKIEFLDYIYNDLGCDDLKLAFSFINDGVLYFSPHIQYKKLIELDMDDKLPGKNYTKRYFLSRVSHRSVLDIEVLFDVDEIGSFGSIKERAKKICEILKENLLDYDCYFTGNKSYHISVLIPQLRLIPLQQRDNIIKEQIGKYGGDGLKYSINTMIALEGEVHYKSGLKKERVNLLNESH